MCVTSKRNKTTRIMKRIFIHILLLLVIGILVMKIFLDPNLFQGLLTNYDSFIHIYNISDTSLEDAAPCLHTKTSPTFIVCIYDIGQDIFISNSLNSTGIWEPKMTKMFQENLRRNRNITVIDVGANIGYFSLLSAALGHHVIAIEPIERNLKIFAKAVILNKFQDKITVLGNAISNERRQVRLNLPSASNQGAGRVLTDDEIPFSTNTIATTSILLDDLVNIIRNKDVIIKIDIEGHECKSIEKSDVLFQTFRVLYVMTEWSKMTSEKYRYGVACYPGNIQKMTRILSARGFVPYDVSTGVQLDPKHSDKWRHNDVFWKHETVIRL